MLFRFLTIITLLVQLTACGTTPKERGLTGAGLGAGSGALIGAVSGVAVSHGAVLGAMAGAFTGIMTDEEQVNLGEPIWKQFGTATDKYPSIDYEKYVTMEIQQGLKNLGYEPGDIDGVYSISTQRAIGKYQADHGLPVDGHVSTGLMEHIKQQQT